MPIDGRPGATVVEARGVAHAFAGAPPVLRELDLRIPGGSLVALIGANGAGKTTLLRILAGVLPPSAGAVSILGVDDPAELGPRGARDFRRRVAYLPQDPALDPEMTGAETLDLFAALHGLGRGERRRRAAALAVTFDLAEHLRRRVEHYSGGLRRRLHLAVGLIHDPELLCLDEPTAGLDPSGCSFLWSELERRARTGRTAVVVTHDLAAAERSADLVLLLEKGELLAWGAPSELTAIAPPDLGAVYRYLTGRDPGDETSTGAVGEEGRQPLAKAGKKKRGRRRKR